MTAERCEKCQGTRIDPTTGGECGCAPEPASAGPAWTAGEWRSHKLPSHLLRVVSADGRVVCQVGHAAPLAPARAVMEANARLISAAPDLYGALAALDARFEAGYPGGPDGDHGGAMATDDDRQLWRNVRAALAKARGQ